LRRHAKASSVGSTNGFAGSVGSGRRAAPVLLVLIAAIGMSLLAAGSATASFTYNVPPQAFDSGRGPGGFVTSGVAVDNSASASAGSIYIPTEAGIDKFSAASAAAGNVAPDSELTGYTIPSGVAVDPANGDLYATDVLGASPVRKYDSSGAPLPFTFDPALAGLAGFPAAIAVSPVNGHVFIAGFGEATVYELDASGSYTGNSFVGPSGISGIAVDSAGKVYVAMHEQGTVVFSAPGSTYTPFALDGEGNPVNSNAIAVAPSNQHVFITGGGRAAEYDAAGTQIGSSFGVGIIGQGNGIGLNADASYAYVADLSTHTVYAFPHVHVPDAVTEAASNVEPSTGESDGGAKLNGTVNPSGAEVTDCEFQYGTSTAYGQAVPCAETPAEIGLGEAPVPVHANLTGLGAGIYHFRLLVGNAEGSSTGSDFGFTIEGPPAVVDESFGQPTQREAELRAEINPGNAETTYHFEYGTSEAYGLTTADKTIPAGNDTVFVKAPIAQLTPETTYHFRVFAENSIGGIAGLDRTFTTPAYPDVGDACPNAAVRALERIPGLAECRAYEQVSPAEKEGVPVNQFPSATRARADGNGVLYGTERSALPGAETNNLVPTVISTRGDDGWLNTPVGAPTTNTGEQASAIFRSVIAVSDDLTRVLTGSKQALGDGGVDGNSNLYIYDLPTKQYTLVATTPDRKLTFDLQGVKGVSEHFAGGTPDLSTLVFESEAHLLPEAPSEGYGLYKWSQVGGLSFVGPASDGLDGALHAEQEVSEDASRIYFQDPGTGFSLKLSENGVTRTVSSAPASNFKGASPDGRYVIYLVNGTGDLIRWDAVTETTDVVGSGVFHVLGVFPESGDAYYTKFGGDVVYSHAGTKKVIGNDGNVFLPKDSPMFSTSPNGRYLIFDSTAQLTAYDSSGAFELYLYDSQTDELTCASCRSDGGPSMGPPHIGMISNGNSVMQRHFAQSVTDQAQVFFDTPNPLVPTDSNGVRDVYSYQDGHVSLISPGTQNLEAIFHEATPSGHDVYFATPQRLVGQDRDNITDMYDARVDGGFRSQNPDPPIECLRDDCKATPSAGPELPFGGSEGLSGPGNVRAPAKKRCGKGRHRVKVRGKSRCVKTHPVRHGQKQVRQGQGR
jgi:sugar lactone lactonase YvrE